MLSLEGEIHDYLCERDRLIEYWNKTYTFSGVLDEVRARVSRLHDEYNSEILKFLGSGVALCIAAMVFLSGALLGAALTAVAIGTVWIAIDHNRNEPDFFTSLDPISADDKQTVFGLRKKREELLERWQTEHSDGDEVPNALSEERYIPLGNALVVL